MNNDEVLGSVQALFQLCGSLLGKVEALQITQDAVIGTLVKESPSMLDLIQRNLRTLAAARDGDVQELARESFRNNIAAAQQRLSTLE